MRVLRNFLILLLTASGIIVVSVLLITNVNQALGWIVMFVLIMLLWPLAQNLRRTGKLFSMETLHELRINIVGGVGALILYIGSGLGFSLILERWYEGWGWIGWLVGPLVAFGVFFSWALRSTGRDVERELEQLRLTMYQNVVEKPGISHTALLRSVEPSVWAADVLRQLLHKKQVKLERRGRVRRYFAQSGDYDEAIRQNPKDAEAYYSRGIVYKLQGRKAEAIADFRKFTTLTKNPKLTQMAKQQIEELSERYKPAL